MIKKLDEDNEIEIVCSKVYGKIVPGKPTPQQIQLQIPKPEETKVLIWGYELCNGAEWKDFLDVVEKLGKEKADLEAKLAESEKELETVCVEGKDTVREFAHLNNELQIQLDRQNKITENLQRENDNLKQQLAESEENLQDAEEHIDNLELQLREQYQLVDEKDKQLAESEEKINMLEQHRFYADNIIQAYADKCKQYEKQIAELTHQHEDKGE